MVSTSLRPARRLCGAALLGVLCAASASAQGFNVDFNSVSGGPVPTAGYAAAGTAGVWNPVLPGTSNVPLLDKSGAATGVTVTPSPTLSFSLSFDNANMTGDDAALLEDIIYGGTSGIWYPITFSGLANGDYEVYTYAIAPDAKTGFVTNVRVVESSDAQQSVGGFLFAGHAQGVTYAVHNAVVTTGTLTVEVAIGTSFISLNGIQIEPGGGGAITSYCNGDGSGTLCPCGNNNDGSNGVAGCANSAGAGGGKLVALGSNSIAAGNLVLSGSTLQTGQAGLYLQGNNATGGGNGTTFGDGLRCAGGQVVRLQIRNSGMTGSSFTTVNIGVVGGVSAGDLKRYQLWFRDTAGPCGSGFNFTNGIEVTWAP